MGHLNNKTGNALDLFPNGVFDAIPKSVFAVVAWHLANICAEEGADNGGAPRRFLQEVFTLRQNGLLDSEQATRVIKAIEKATK